MVLETNRLILRPFDKENANDVFEYLKESLKIQKWDLYWNLIQLIFKKKKKSQPN